VLQADLAYLKKYHAGIGINKDHFHVSNYRYSSVSSCV
jgi:hypothetical protein